MSKMLKTLSKKKKSFRPYAHQYYVLTNSHFKMGDFNILMFLPNYNIADIQKIISNRLFVTLQNI